MTATKAALSEIKATGLATEYYKSILSGIEELKKVNANKHANSNSPRRLLAVAA
jgi:hypothetical protein